LALPGASGGKIVPRQQRQRTRRAEEMPLARIEWAGAALAGAFEMGEVHDVCQFKVQGSKRRSQVTVQTPLELITVFEL
jgi:hypothetical protein